MIIDAHHHIWDYDRIPQTWMSEDQAAVLGRDFTPADWVADAAGTGVEAAILIQSVARHDETRDLLRHTLTQPSVLGVVGWIDADAGACDAQLQRILEAPGADKLVGVRDLTVYRTANDWLESDDASGLAGAAGRHGLAMDIVVTPAQLPSLRWLAAEHPDVGFIINHLGNVDVDRTTPTDWSHTLAPLAALPNVALKLSALAARTRDTASLPTLLPGFLHTALDRFGAERIMFGSDWPVSSMRISYAAMVELVSHSLAGLTANERGAIWGTTAMRWYRLRTPPAEDILND